MPRWPEDPYDALDEMVAQFGVRIVKTWFTSIEDRQQPVAQETPDPEPEMLLIPGWDDA